jgi:hypothetical protein
MQAPKTNFEQIPVATVKKIAHEFFVSEIGGHMHDGDNSRHEGWREVAKRIQVENDTDKVGELVQELIEKYDEQKLRPCRSSRHAR